MRKSLTIFAALMLMTGMLFAQPANHGKRQTVTLKASAMNSKGGTNPHIKTGKPASDQKSKTRGPGAYDCYVYLHNSTDFCIDVYVDGNFATTLAAYGDATVLTGNGWTAIYGISCGTTTEWNGDGVGCDVYADYYFTD